MNPKGSGSSIVAPLQECPVKSTDDGCANNNSHWTKSQEEDAAIGRIIGNRYKILAKIGAGAFGVIYEGVDAMAGTSIAIKIEPKGIKVRQLAYEAQVYRELHGICKFLFMNWARGLYFSFTYFSVID